MKDVKVKVQVHIVKAKRKVFTFAKLCWVYVLANGLFSERDCKRDKREKSECLLFEVASRKFRLTKRLK